MTHFFEFLHLQAHVMKIFLQDIQIALEEFRDNFLVLRAPLEVVEYKEQNEDNQKDFPVVLFLEHDFVEQITALLWQREN